MSNVFYTPILKTKKGKKLNFQPMPFRKTTLKEKNKKKIEKIIENL